MDKLEQCVRSNVEQSEVLVTEVHPDLIVRFPARRGYLSISRLNATALAADNGFDIDELDDLRLAVDEAVAWLIDDGRPETSEPGTDREVELRISFHGGRLEFTGTRSGPTTEVPDVSELVHAVLTVTVDHYETGVDDDGHLYVKLAKHPAADV